MDPNTCLPSSVCLLYLFVPIRDSSVLLLLTGTHSDLEDGTNIVAWLNGARELNEAG